MKLLNTFFDEKYGLNCSEKLLAYPSLWFGRRYEMMFLNTWQFDFVPQKNNIIGMGICPQEWETTKLLEKYHGVRCTTGIIENIDDFIALMKNELIEGRPIVCGFKNIYSTWAPKADCGATMLLIIGISDNNDTITAYDVHLNWSLRHTVTLSFEHLAKGYTGEYMSYSIVAGEKLDLDYCSLILDRVNTVYTKNRMFEKINNFASYFNEDFNFVNEKQGYEHPMSVPMIRKIEDIAIGRALFSYLLKYIGEIYLSKEITDISEAFLSNKWRVVRSILAKYYYNDSPDIDIRKIQLIADTIKEIASEEEEAANSLINIFNNLETKSKTASLSYQKNTSTVSSDRIAPINISYLFNNNAFTNDVQNKYQADFTGIFHSFLTAGIHKIYDNAILKSRSLFFPTIIEGKNNNVSCQNTEININLNCCTSIYIIATSEYGSFIGDLDIICNSKENFKLHVEFSDWCEKAPLYGEEIAWSGDVVIGRGEEAYIPQNAKHNIYWKEFVLLEAVDIEKIILPVNPSLHIFAMSIKTN